MKGFVLDASVTMRWLLASPKQSDQAYAHRVLKAMLQAQAWVPLLWHWEVCSVILRSEKSGDISRADIEPFTSQLEELPIEIDLSQTSRSFANTLNLAKTYKLSSYDSAYLELAIRKSLPMASLDQGLRKAAKKAGVELFLIS